MDQKTKNAIAGAATASRAAARLLASPTPDERFNERLNDVPDLEAAMNGLLDTLSPLRGIDDEPALHANSMAEALRDAGTAEVESDLDANLLDALSSGQALMAALKATRAGLKDLGEADREAVKEALGEAIPMLRTMLADIKNL